MVVLNFNEETANIETVSRYNGGWLKTVEGLDKSKNNGYSIVGDFVKAGDFSQNYQEGLYIDCSKDGSRKNQEWNYHLFQVTEKGFELLMTLEDAGRNWAVDFWDCIEKNLNKSESVSAQDIANEIFEKVGNDKKLLSEVVSLLKEETEDKYGFHYDIATLDEIRSYLRLNGLHEVIVDDASDDEKDQICDEVDKVSFLDDGQKDIVKKSVQSDSEDAKSLIFKFRTNIPFEWENCSYPISDLHKFKTGFFAFINDELWVMEAGVNECKFINYKLIKY